jgi:chaperonin GroEL
VALIRSLEGLSSLKVSKNEQFGVDLIKRAVEEPLRMIVENAGYEGSIVLNKIKENNAAIGFNAAIEEYGDLIKWGIIDPTKVTRTALQNAVSIASLLLTTEALIVEKVEIKNNNDMVNSNRSSMNPGNGMSGMNDLSGINTY